MGETKWAVLALVFSFIGVAGLAECTPPAKCQSCGNQCMDSRGCAMGCVCMRGAYGLPGECIELQPRDGAQ